eukprot:7341539-Pyramimonas_sp.AAC.1
MDIDKAFAMTWTLTFLAWTYEELAHATGEATRMVCFALPPGPRCLAPSQASLLTMKADTASGA